MAGIYLNRSLLALKDMINWFISPSFIDTNMVEYDIKNIAKLIHNNKLENKFIKPAREIRRNIEIERYNGEDYPNYIENSIKNITNILMNDDSAKYIESVNIHGSIASKDFIQGWSDLDTWIIIDEEKLENPECLLMIQKLFSRLNTYLLKIDTVSHHGFQVYPKGLLSQYLHYLLPVEVINSGLNIYGQRSFQINTVYFQPELNIRRYNNNIISMIEYFNIFKDYGIFKHHPYKGEYLDSNLFASNQGMYQLKYIISYMVNMPMFYLNVHGYMHTKPESIHLICTLFPKEADILKIFSAIRARWEHEEHPSYTPNTIPSWVKEMLPKDYISKIIKLLETLKIEE